MSSLWMPLDGPWTFDAVSALVGAGAGLVIGAAAAYRFRAAIERTLQNARGQVTHTRERLTMGAQQRYLEWITHRVAALHVLREGVGLSDLYLVPEFVTPPLHPSVSAKPAEPPPPTVPLAAVLKATPRLVVTGAPGSGRSALLAHLVRAFAEDNAQAALGIEEHRLPIYLHLGELALTGLIQSEQPVPLASLADAPASPAPAPTKPADPTQPLIDAVAARLPLLIQAGAPGMLRNSIKRGEAILLLDGLDELEADARSSAMRWITSFCAANAGVRVVVAAAPLGLAPLLDAGFTAISLAPWTPAHVTQLAERWARAAKGGEQDAARLAETLKPVPGTLPLPIDVTLAAFMWQKRGSVPPNRATAYGQTVDIFLESVQASSPMSPLLARAAMGRLALSLFKENRFTATRAEIEKLVVELLPPPRDVADFARKVQAADAKPVPPPPPPTPAPVEPGTEAPPPAPVELPKPKGVPESVEALLKCGLLVERGAHGTDRFAFAHRRVQGYLAAWQITQSGEGALLMQHLEDAEWSDVLEFCAGLVNVAPLVDMLLKRDDDLFHSRLWTVATWAASAGQDVAWRGKVLAQLAQFFMQPDQLAPLRQRAMLALLSTQDKGLGYVFKQALASPDPLVRALALRGLGMLGREQDLPTFEAALKDPDASVGEAAVRATGSVGGTAGIEHLANVLLEADESLRKVAALTLAEGGAEGQRLLKDAVREDDMLVRRATTYGLAATRADWAREILTKLEKDDPQWFVRSAASEALASMKEVEEYALDCSPIVLDRQGWLVEWGATRGMPVGLGRSAEPVLMRALAEGDTPVKLAAIQTLANIGGEAAIEPLRAQLVSSDPDVHAAAYQALKAISDKTGIKIARR